MMKKGGDGVHPVFAPFVEAVLSQLRFLETEYGLAPAKVLGSPPECAIMYIGEHLRVTAHYEYGMSPWLSVSVKGKGGAWKEAAIDWLESEAIDPQTRTSSPKDSGHIGDVIAVQAVALRKTLPSILKAGEQRLDQALERSRKADQRAVLEHLAGLNELVKASRLPLKDRAFLQSLEEAMRSDNAEAIRRHLDDDLQLAHQFSPATTRRRRISAWLAQLTIAIQDSLE